MLSNIICLLVAVMAATLSPASGAPLRTGRQEPSLLSPSGQQDVGDTISTVDAQAQTTQQPPTLLTGSGSILTTPSQPPAGTLTTTPTVIMDTNIPVQQLAQAPGAVNVNTAQDNTYSSAAALQSTYTFLAQSVASNIPQISVDEIASSELAARQYVFTSFLQGALKHAAELAHTAAAANTGINNNINNTPLSLTGTTQTGGASMAGANTDTLQNTQQQTAQSTYTAPKNNNMPFSIQSIPDLVSALTAASAAQTVQVPPTLTNLVSAYQSYVSSTSTTSSQTQTQPPSLLTRRRRQLLGATQPASTTGMRARRVV